MTARAKPKHGLHRETAEQLLHAVLDRAREINAPDSPFAIRVKRIVVFGSYLKGKDRPNDIDLIVEDEHRYADQRAQQACEAERLCGFKGQNTFIDRVLWPYTEVRRFLKQRSSRISIHGADELGGLHRAGEPVQQVFP